METIDIKEIFNYFKSKIIIIFMIVLLFGTIGFVYSYVLKTPEYVSYTTVLLKNDKNQNDTYNSSDASINKGLLGTYSKIVKSKKILREVITNLNLTYGYSDLYNMITVSSEDNTEIIQITCTSIDPKMAADIANEVGDVFVKQVPKIYHISNVSILDEAEVPLEAYNLNTNKEIFISAMIGLIVGLGLVFILYYFDKSIKSKEQVEAKLELPVLAEIQEINDKNKELIVKEKPKSAISEDIRTLRTNVEFSLSNGDDNILMVTSSLPSEGKTFISSNLAIALSENGYKVLLIDSDLRLGRLHKIFDLSNDNGLSNLISKYKNNIDIKKYINKTNINNLFVITRGIVPPNPSELLSTSNFKNILEKVKKDYDYIILDSTPVNGLSDSLVLSKVSDKSLIVALYGKTNIDALNDSKKALENVNASVSGIVINILPKGKSKYGYYYYGEKGKKKKKKGKKKKENK